MSVHWWAQCQAKWPSGSREFQHAARTNLMVVNTQNEDSSESISTLIYLNVMWCVRVILSSLSFFMNRTALECYWIYHLTLWSIEYLFKLSSTISVSTFCTPRWTPKTPVYLLFVCWVTTSKPTTYLYFQSQCYEAAQQGACCPLLWVAHTSTVLGTQRPSLGEWLRKGTVAGRGQAGRMSSTSWPAAFTEQNTHS